MEKELLMFDESLQQICNTIFHIEHSFFSNLYSCCISSHFFENNKFQLKGIQWKRLDETLRVEQRSYFL